MAGARATATILAALPVLGVLLGQLIGARPLSFLLSGHAGGWLLVVGSMLACVGLLWSDRITDRLAGMSAAAVLLAVALWIGPGPSMVRARAGIPSGALSGGRRYRGRDMARTRWRSPPASTCWPCAWQPAWRCRRPRQRPPRPRHRSWPGCCAAPPICWRWAPIPLWRGRFRRICRPARPTHTSMRCCGWRGVRRPRARRWPAASPNWPTNLATKPRTRPPRPPSGPGF